MSPRQYTQYLHIPSGKVIKIPANTELWLTDISAWKNPSISLIKDLLKGKDWKILKSETKLCLPTK